MDDRGRVPFALLGVLLLVSSATLATTIDPARPPTDSDTEVVVERTTATTQTALREAVSTVSSDAATDPVIEPANTTAGGVLNDSTPFRDALRLRIYVAARDRLADVAVRRDDVTGTVSLPPVSTASQLRAAKRRVHVERVDENGTAIRVRIENVTLRTRRNGETVARERFSPTVTVATPVLVAHDRVSTYQQRLDATLTERGLSQRLTAQLYALAWSRGYSQWGGVPITNVVSNQHVSVVANQALLSLQRSTIGHSDPRGRRTLNVAAGRTIARELTVATERDTRVTDALLKGPTSPTDSEIQGLEMPQRSGPSEKRVIGINGTADDAFVDLLGDNTIAATTRAAYSVEVRTVGRVEGDRQVDATTPSQPEGNWTQVDRERNQTRWHRNVTLTPPVVRDDWHALATYSRQTVTRERITHTWKREIKGDNETTETVRRTTSNVATARQNVSVAIVGRHTHTSPAPNRTIRTAHERGAGRLGGPNLADARRVAIDRTIGSEDGRDRILESAARGDLDDGMVAYPLSRPANITEWAYRDLMRLRERVRELNVTVEQGGLGSFRENPPAALADKLDRRRANLLDAPRTYDSAATKARIAVRAAYLDRVESRLRARASSRSEQKDNFSAALDDVGTSMTNLTESLEAQERPSPGRQPRVDGPGGELRLTADAAPAYLTRSELTHDQIPAIDDRSHPLVARNTNLVSVPYQTASDAVIDGLLGTNSRVPLRAAAQTLNATNVTLERLNDSALSDPREYRNRSNEGDRAALGVIDRVRGLRQRQRDLQPAVTDAAGHIRASQREVLAEHGIGDDEPERKAMVQRALDPWNTTHGRALALANGSVSRRLTVVADRRANLSVTERDRLALRLNGSRERALGDEGARPKTDIVNASRSATHQVVRELGREAAGSAAERATRRAYRRTMKRSFSQMPAGLPLAPVPGYWYATTNLWHVEVRGEYARFGVRASQGRPTTPGGEFVYARDGERVTLDVDGDGDAERLGRSTRVDFSATATVLVVVPPGGTGVGDTNGVTVEQSKGWPRPGAE